MMTHDDCGSQLLAQTFARGKEYNVETKKEETIGYIVLKDN